MSLRIYHNITAMTAYRNLTVSDNMLSKSLERLSSGLRINKAADDAAGLGISQRMRAQISGLQMASRNASQAVNVVQTAEGSMNEIHNMLTRMRELAVQASSDSVGSDDRGYLNSEFTALKNEIDRIATSTEYNGTKLINGSYTGNTVSSTASVTTATPELGVQEIALNGANAGTYTITDSSGSTLTMTNGTTTQTITLTGTGTSGAPADGETITANFSELGITLTLNQAYDDADLDGKKIVVESGSGGQFQVGADNAADNRISFTIGNLQASGTTLGLSSVVISSKSAAQSAIDSIDTAIDAVNSQRSNLGAVQNRLGYTIASVNNQAENIQASESTIRDADFALEMSSYTRAQILVQAGTSMLAQANATPQTVLTLLRG
ncbi:MAG: flagellin [Calditrichaeota bacterium]|nr:flagellin [Calditrichota bacterium]